MTDLGGSFAKLEEIYSLLACGRVRTCSAVLIAHTIPVFCILHFASPLVSSFNDMGSSLTTSSGLLVRDISSVE